MKCLNTDGPDAETNRANVRTNLKRHLYFIDEMAGRGAEFVGFPELSLSGCHFSKTSTWLSLTGPEVKALRQKAAEKGVYVCAGLAELDGAGKKWNTQFVIDPRGEIAGRHHKILLHQGKGLDRGRQRPRRVRGQGPQGGHRHLRRWDGSENLQRGG